MDYRHTATEIGEKEYISLRLIISELRNQYVTLHDMILKNIEKIKQPRSSNAETLYWGQGQGQGQGTLWVWLKTDIALVCYMTIVMGKLAGNSNHTSLFLVRV